MRERIVQKKTVIGCMLILFIFGMIPLCSNPGSPECEQQVRQFINSVDNGEYEKAIEMTAENRAEGMAIYEPLSETRRLQRINYLIGKYGRNGEKFNGEIAKIDVTYARNQINSSYVSQYCFVEVIAKDQVGKAPGGSDYMYSFNLYKINDNPWKFSGTHFTPV